ncbi:MAG: hypothetical protein HY517_01355 [Candidatus Aenigmarchaeota archaeon]|nr:hypothetical protein [Candidatus Aenigmarchaeota archaeon]
MGVITLSIDEESEKLLRKLTEEEGGKKGDMSKIVGDAIKRISDEKKQREIAERQKKMSEKGLYSLPKNWKFKRDEIYDRK